MSDDTKPAQKRGKPFESGDARANPGGRPRKAFTEDVQEYARTALNLQGVREIVKQMTTATKLCGKDSVEHPDWNARLSAFVELRDTFIGRPTQVVSGEDGNSLIDTTAIVAVLKGLAK